MRDAVLASTGNLYEEVVVVSRVTAVKPELQAIA